MDPLDLISLNPRPSFRRQPLPILGEYRLLWQISLIVVLLHLAGRSERGKKNKRLALRKLHILGWGVRSERACTSLLARLQAKLSDIPAIRIDPSFNQSIDFAHAESIVFRSSRHVELTPSGQELALQIADLGALVEERRRAVLLKPYCTEKAIDRMSKIYDR